MSDVWPCVTSMRRTDGATLDARVGSRMALIHPRVRAGRHNIDQLCRKLMEDSGRSNLIYHRGSRRRSRSPAFSNLEVVYAKKITCHLSF